jgi:translation initiation factor IF-3
MVIEGKLHTKFDTQQVSDSFKKRDFVVDFQENPLYPQFITFQLVQDRVSLIDAFSVGDKIEVTFNLRGREWTGSDMVKKYFNTLEAWRVQKAEAAPAPANTETSLPPDNSDDLPF